MSEDRRLKEKIYCHVCKVRTNHSYIEKYIEEVHNVDDSGFSWIDEYYIAKCLGCDSISFYREYGDVDMIEYNSCGEMVHYTDKYVYPEEPVKIDYEQTFKYKLLDFKSAPEVIQELYKQVVSSFELQHYLLAAVGLRMIIEGFCNDQEIVDGVKYTNAGNVRVDENGDIKRFSDLEGRINGMEEKKLITPVNTKILHQIRHLGNATAHELEVPKRSTILNAIKIIENLITNVYVYKKIDILND